MAIAVGVPSSALRFTHITRSHSRTILVSQASLPEPLTVISRALPHSASSGSGVRSAPALAVAEGAALAMAEGAALAAAEAAALALAEGTGLGSVAVPAWAAVVAVCAAPPAGGGSLSQASRARHRVGSS